MARRFDLVAYLKLVRFPLVFTAIADSAAGYCVGTSNKLEFSGTLALLALASGCLYLFGMALNDIADLEKDREAAPGKVLPSGRVSRIGAIAIAWILLGVSLAAICWIPATPLLNRLLLWGCVVLAILAYDLHWIKMPPIMGFVRACNLLLGVVAVVTIRFDSGLDGAHPWKCAALAAPLFIYGTSLTYVSTLEDAALDRRKLMIGAVGMSIGALLAATVVPLILILTHGHRHTGQLVLSLAAAWILVAWIVRRARRANDRKGLMLMVRDGVAGYILVDAAIVLSEGPPLKGLLVASLLAPAILSLYIFKKLV
ncbi:MAG TPA: UbiA family prenyltransferase [Planctomycetota bacterium]|nr:UbiA family prenyltransferase [Planctomycetota bacterium]